MKKLILTLVVLAMAAPLYAVGGITFVATDAAGVSTVTFTATDPCIPPVAMGLDITVDGDDPDDRITAVDGIDSFFDIYMDYAYDDPCSYTYGLGNPIAKVAEAGGDTLPSLSFCISMGGLGGPSAPLYPAPTSGTAFVLHAGNAVADPCDLVTPEVTGTISINAIRGGVIGTDTEAMTTNLSIPFSINISGDCFQPSDPCELQTWINVGKPECWCYQLQCRGDADGFFDGKDKDGKRQYVSLSDLATFNAGWLKPETDPGFSSFVCADFNHAFDGKDKDGKRQYVSLGDLAIFNAGWLKPETDVHFSSPICPGDPFIVPVP